MSDAAIWWAIGTASWLVSGGLLWFSFRLASSAQELLEQAREHAEDAQEHLEEALRIHASGVAAERERIAKRCQTWATERFDEHGPQDARGAALWDVAVWIREHHVVGTDEVGHPYRVQCACGEWCYNFAAHVKRMRGGDDRG